MKVVIAELLEEAAGSSRKAFVHLTSGGVLVGSVTTFEDECVTMTTAEGWTAAIDGAQVLAVEISEGEFVPPAEPHAATVDPVAPSE